MIESQNYIAIPPGATIKEQLDMRGMTLTQFSGIMGYSEEIALELLEGQVELTQDIALKLESLVGIPHSFWNNLERDYRNHLILVENDNDIT